jgi:hypothetical protein
MKKIQLGILLGLIAIGITCAVISTTITSQTPDTETITKAATFDFAAVSTNPFSVGDLHVEVDVGSTHGIHMACTNSPPNYPCALNGYDISGLSDDIYPIVFRDNTGDTTPVNLIIDRNIVAGDFGFAATDYEVSYILNCDCTPSGCDTEQAQYNKDDAGWVDFDISNPQDFTVTGTGSYIFRGYCKDNAGNEAYTDETGYTLPASPPQLKEVYILPSTDELCDETFPCELIDQDGSGEPIDMSLKLEFDKEAILQARLNGGAWSAETDPAKVQVVSLYHLIDGL